MERSAMDLRPEEADAAWNRAIDGDVWDDHSDEEPEAKPRVILAIYADGGVIQKNPSPQGGTWAWCHVGTDLRVVEDVTPHLIATGSGLLLPNKRGLGETVSNNHSEYFALVKGLLALPEGWSGKVYSDSAVTLGRFFSGWGNKNVPESWTAYRKKALGRLGKLEPILLDGHPTWAQLASGVGKRGNPCSSFNVWCDRACNAEAAQSQVIDEFIRETVAA